MEENKKTKKEKKSKVKGLMTDDEIKKRNAKKTRTMISVFVLLLAVGIGGNWYWENSDLSTKISTVGNSKTFGEATYVDATTEPQTNNENEYFSSARVDRQSARDASLEQLQKVVNATEETDDARRIASEKIAMISTHIEIENKIEALIQAKGVNNCLAIVSEDGGRVDVIVDSNELTDDLILQIKEISTAQLGCSFENVTIVQSK